jgi:uncharacterized protein YdeI (YjbR/CyaY-like superfamily)
VKRKSADERSGENGGSADTARFFAAPAEFRRWLAANHGKAEALWVGFHKQGTGKPSLTWPESVDEALCFGWIDGVRKSLGEESYAIRFTPRKPTSIWSKRNLGRMEELVAAGKVMPAGLAAFERRTAEKTGVYSFEQRDAPVFDETTLATFRADARAWDGFAAQPPGYRRLATFYVMSAKRPETRAKRLEQLMECSRQGRKLPRPGDPKAP